MDSRLIAWGRAVKRRQKTSTPLWFFTDETRTPDPLAVISQLPMGLCGVVFRHDSHPDRADLAKKIARLCRARKLTLIIAGDARLARLVQAGLHLRGGQGRPNVTLRGRLLSASVHDSKELRQAHRAGVKLAFMSPIFPTASHPDAAVLGVAGWRRLARQRGRIKSHALGGITGRRVRALGPDCTGIGAIDAFF